MSFLDRIHPERGAAGFTKHNGTIRFYNFVKAIMAQVDAKRILDFGAGRGGPMETDIWWRRELQDLRQLGAEVWAADLDTAVLQHPASHHQVVLEMGAPLPFPDDHFDVIVSDWTFEHIDAPEHVASELLRVVRPGGYICARTANKHGYLKLAASAVPNRLHTRVLDYVQPNRKHEDIFPTVYKMNSVGQVRRLFPGCDVFWYRHNSEPAYYFGIPILYRMFSLLHRLLPETLSVSICFFIRKRTAKAG